MRHAIYTSAFTYLAGSYPAFPPIWLSRQQTYYGRLGSSLWWMDFLLEVCSTVESRIQKRTSTEGRCSSMRGRGWKIYVQAGALEWGKDARVECNKSNGRCGEFLKDSAPRCWKANPNPLHDRGWWMSFTSLPICWVKLLDWSCHYTLHCSSVVEVYMEA